MPKHNYELIGDRGFQGHDMIEMFKGSGWEYVIRLSKNYCAKKKNSPKFVQLSLFEDGFYEDVTIGKNNPIENVNLSVNSIKNEEGERVVWYLLSSLKNQERVIKDYERRMWIEESFKDLKSTLNWEKYTKKVPEKGRLEKMIIISCLSYAIRLSLGEQVEIPPSEKNKTSVLKRFQHILSNSYRTIAKLFNTVISLYRMNYQRSYPYFANMSGNVSHKRREEFKNAFFTQITPFLQLDRNISLYQFLTLHLKRRWLPFSSFPPFVRTNFDEVVPQATRLFSSSKRARANLTFNGTSP